MYSKDWISRWAMYSPEKVAIEELETGRSITYAQLNRRANFLAEWMTKNLGLSKGDRVMVMAEHCIDYVTLFSIAQKTGIILVPVNYRLAASEIDYLIKDADPACLIVENKFADIAKALQVELPRMELEMLPEGESETFVPHAIHEDDPLFILYTSGSTGFPKGAMYSHKMLLWNSLNTTQSLEITADDHTVNCMPPFHTGGWNVLLTPMLHRGATVCLMKKFDADRVLEQIDKSNANLFMGVPTMLKMMAESAAFQSCSLASIRYFIVGGEALPLPVIHLWHERGVKIRQGYGLTEVGPNITSLHQEYAAQKIGSIGLPNFYVEYALLDDLGNQVPPGEVGEFCLKGPMVTPGYWKNPEATAQSIVHGFFHTGDLVRQDADGFLYIVDRKKCMFISGGENVYPAEVERVLRELEVIDEAAVVGVKDPKWGEVGKAYLSIKSGMTYTKDGIIAHCQSRLARFKVPRYLEIVNELPKNGSGKIDRKKLASLA
ncbi:class I adenylate-forming enzyme family protein [Marinoscillum furvescens]|uniref:Fatty-acyl-CoA synthase n=1 Tax=Marinoscillum furvescens DSM 4134 TaxID=1122208 RepID=A0A3D9L0N0_MARFU|nr:long-chain fatty acid--CoA ligase [Marinoscillum furvescens]RED94946.1 fatty-acyl-CoA synthase [Marinoscillum furvescens DSM 4134]